MRFSRFRIFGDADNVRRHRGSGRAIFDPSPGIFCDPVCDCHRGAALFAVFRERWLQVVIPLLSLRLLRLSLVVFRVSHCKFLYLFCFVNQGIFVNQDIDRYKGPINY